MSIFIYIKFPLISFNGINVYQKYPKQVEDYFVSSFWIIPVIVRVKKLTCILEKSFDFVHTCIGVVSVCVMF